LEILGIDDQSKIDIPTLQKGDIVSLVDNRSVISKKETTQPPSRFSEALLLKQLESFGIGRPATYATLISTITNRNYVEKKGNTYYPTELGKNIIGIL
jgi:DNA topoisomerase-1